MSDAAAISIIKKLFTANKYTYIVSMRCTSFNVIIFQPSLKVKVDVGLVSKCRAQRTPTDVASCYSPVREAQKMVEKNL